MDTETGEIFRAHTAAQQKVINELIAQGEPIVPVSEKVATQQRAGQIAMNRAERRVKRRGQNNRKT